MTTVANGRLPAGANDPHEFGLFVELAAVTGARPSQIVRLEVRDLLDGSEPRLMMPASRKGKGKKAKSHYRVPISAELAELGSEERQPPHEREYSFALRRASGVGASGPE